MNSILSKQDLLQMQDYFFSGATRSYRFRKKQLQRLYNALQAYEQEIAGALYEDLHKSPEEAYATETGIVYAEIEHALANLQEWMEPQTVATPLLLQISNSRIIKDALGVVLIIAPWNYPVNLVFAPLVGAIAGGNCAVIKPSEFTPHTSVVIKKIIDAAFDRNYITVAEGDGATVIPALMNDFRFDHIFFTGSIATGKAIARLAADQLIPVTLELGGKSPCIVDKDTSIPVAAQRIVWGKFTNAGQTCVAPDYLLVQESRKDELVDKMQKSIIQFYGADPRKSHDYGRIINEKRFDALSAYLQQGTIITGGQTDKESLYIAPTLLQDVGLEQPVMQEEIFGPVLPILTYQEHEEALQIIRSNPNPLSLYLFSSNKTIQRLYINNVSFGGGCINNTLVHLANTELPFGGTGNSGMGQYHGKYGFDTFTRPKSVVQTTTWPDPNVKYPPYAGKLKLLKWLLP